MGTLKGLIQFTGKFDGLSFYEMNGKIIVRKTGGFDGEKIKKESNYARVRENSREFASSAKAGKYFRASVHSYLKKLNIPYIHNSIVSLFQKITKFDIVSSRGDRKIAVGLATPEGLQAITDFEFNKQVRFSSLFPFVCTVDFEKGSLIIPHFTLSALQKPKGATHISIQFISLGLDFALQNQYSCIEGTSLTYPIKGGDTEITTIAMTCMMPAAPVVMGLLFIGFSQGVNAIDYTLADSYLKIVAVKT
jgi:hypothetical protein